MNFPQAIDTIKNWLRNKEIVDDIRILNLVDGDTLLQRILIDSLLKQEFATYNGKVGIVSTGKDEPSVNVIYDLFISYSRTENISGHVDWIINDIIKGYKARTDRTLQIFFDRASIKIGQDWKETLHAAIRHSKVFIAIISPNYLKSEMCKYEWNEFVAHQQNWMEDNEYLNTGNDSIIPAYLISIFHVLSTDPTFPDEWHKDIRKRNLLDLTEWFAEESPINSIEKKPFQNKIGELIERCCRKLEDAKLYKTIPDNIPPFFRTHLPRINLLHEIRNVLINCPVIGIWGFAGIGKSTLALSYAKEYKLQYAGGCWHFQAENMKSIPDLLRKQLPSEWRIEISEDENKNEESTWLRIKDHLARPYIENKNNRTLLIFDNAENAALVLDDDSIKSFIPRGVDVIITCREKVYGMLLSNWDVQVEALSESEGIQLLRQYRPFNTSNDLAMATAIVQQLGGYILGLTIVGVYLVSNAEKNTSVTYETILEGLIAENSVFLDFAGKHIRSLPGVYDNQFKKWGHQVSYLLNSLIHCLDEKQLITLEYAALFPPDSIIIPWLKELLQNIYPETFTKSAYYDEWNELIITLKRLAFLSDTDDPKIVRMHRVLTDFLKNRTNTKNERLEKLMVVANREISNVSRLWHHQENKWIVKPLLDFGQLIISERESEKDEIYLTHASSLAKDLGLYSYAKECMEKVVAICEKLVPGDDKRLLGAYSNLGYVLQEDGNLDICRIYTEKALRIAEKVYKSNAPELAVQYSNYAMILHGLGDYISASKWMEKAIKIDTDYYVSGHEILGIRNRNYAMILDSLNNFDGALQGLANAIAIFRSLYDPMHPTLADCYSKACSVLHRSGEPGEALEWAKKAIAIQETIYTPTHRKLASSYFNLAMILRDLNDRQSALLYTEKAMAIDKVSYPTDHPEVAIGYVGHAWLLYEMQDYVNAKQSMQTAHSIFQNTLGEKHPHTLTAKEALRKYFNN